MSAVSSPLPGTSVMCTTVTVSPVLCRSSWPSSASSFAVEENLLANFVPQRLLCALCPANGFDVPWEPVLVPLESISGATPRGVEQGTMATNTMKPLPMPSVYFFKACRLMFYSQENVYGPITLLENNTHKELPTCSSGRRGCAGRCCAYGGETLYESFFPASVWPL